MSKQLPKIKTRRGKRQGRGFGSGKGGHTVGRGMKGQKSRSKIGILFEGVKMKKSLIKRLPLARGKGKFKARPKPVIVKLTYLNLLPSGSKVNVESLVKHGILKGVDASRLGVKILGGGVLNKKLSVELPTSKSAAKAIEKAGGKVVVVNTKAQISNDKSENLKPKTQKEKNNNKKTPKK